MLRFFTVIAFVVLSACSQKPSTKVFGDKTMGTSWSVKLISAGFQHSDSEIKNAIQTRLDDIEAKMSSWKDDSEVSRFNVMSTGCMPVSKETALVVEKALLIAEQTQGALDITLGPLIELWGFGKKIGTNEVPSDTEIASILDHIGYQAVSVQDEQLCKSEDAISINVSAIAKGFAVDEVAAVLNQLGYDRYLVEVGGELFGMGNSPRNMPWAIGVEKPLAGMRAVMENVIIPLESKGLATSGDYRIFFEQEGKRYSHLLDPTTGKPVVHQVASVTVLTDSSMMADGYATALQVMGVERGIALANDLDLAVMILAYGEEEQVLATASDSWKY